MKIDPEFINTLGGTLILAGTLIAFVWKKYKEYKEGKIVFIATYLQDLLTLHNKLFNVINTFNGDINELDELELTNHNKLKKKILNHLTFSEIQNFGKISPGINKEINKFLEFLSENGSREFFDVESLKEVILNKIKDIQSKLGEIKLPYGINEHDIEEIG